MLLFILSLIKGGVVFRGCECGDYECSYCGPILEELKKAQEIKLKNIEKKRIKLKNKCKNTKMPFGKYKGFYIADLPLPYVYAFIVHRFDKTAPWLLELLEFTLGDYSPPKKRGKLIHTDWSDWGEWDPWGGQ